MNKLLIALLLLISASQIFAQPAAISYPVDSASIEQPGVPKGEVLKFTFENSAIFPGTWREYWVYVPAQYRADKPACVYVGQDGIQWKAPTVFDNLIYRNEMPVTIGVFVMHGRVRAANGTVANDRFNRSFEYDGLGDAYARFILEEILPAVEKQKTTDGRAIHLSKNGNDRAIGGLSSGAVCAFTAAWEKPAEFSRVFSAIGTYIGLRGTDDYPTLIRKYEPKPLRFFLQDGSNDLNIYAGDWWMANQTMERALTFSGYEVTHVWGEDGHNGNHGTSIFPAAMRWLWKDWPKPITTGASKNKYLSELLIPGQDWELVGEGYGFTEGTAANAKGEVFFQDIPGSKTYKIGLDGKVTMLPLDAKKASVNCFDADGKRYTTAAATKQIIRYDANGKATVVANDIDGNDLVVAKNGNIYVTAPDGSEKPGKLILIRPNGEKVIVDEGIKYPNGVALTPDQTQLYVTESASKWVWIYSINADGTLTNKQRYGWLHVPDDAGNAWSDGLKSDTAGRVYVTSRLGIQVMDQLGRVNAIIPIPGGQASNVCFGGPGFDVLYVSSRDKIYRRKLKTRGINPFEMPYRPMQPGL
ncbi:MAG: SMP-30/Gluconolaconase/LRE-like region-containing protein [Ferruginibacter sp.]|uniref:SMP-30/gluconolactonase/LRE family protein n=1 Tax=Ferruginibacter sp. TaxID=1940288 RepID=UPI002659E8F4|nr:SMP-30/gluconolactonase/LRE family protein [Ferruginibacter sp.]MDB5275634.1 SMP-30/Gluconolaconase/LRE-like region-containing protein [Ferruginibacter sp.]